ncbi:hypothetical protein ACFOED_09000 [Vulcaniibacterium thermophilum]|uniref:Uncharacterized protein n=1 Tax=Vulcaniibacterium thermophilum TaxID=1169913 RepID=A0A918ZBV3_9GAMM|nr:hypothetical protein [Vulcaniibacterium thermophilum]GHE42359.1 hypothetical protein GCM10007167_25360 [Vulcaniibacterium thermophilum]
MAWDRDRLDRELDALQARLPELIRTHREGEFYAAFRREADRIRVQTAREDFAHVGACIARMLENAHMIPTDAEHPLEPKPEVATPAGAAGWRNDDRAGHT